MITDKQLFVQMLERDVLNLYETLVQRVPLCSLPMVKQTAFSYADKGIEYITNLLFGIDENSSIDEASDYVIIGLSVYLNKYYLILFILSLFGFTGLNQVPKYTETATQHSEEK